MQNENSGTPMMSHEELREFIRVAVRSELRSLVSELIKEQTELLRPDSCEIDEDSKGVPHPKIKVYANGIHSAVTDAVAAYRNAKAGVNG